MPIQRMRQSILQQPARTKILLPQTCFKRKKETNQTKIQTKKLSPITLRSSTATSNKHMGELTMTIRQLSVTLQQFEQERIVYKPENHEPANVDFDELDLPPCVTCKQLGITNATDKCLPENIPLCPKLTEWLNQ